MSKLFLLQISLAFLTGGIGVTLLTFLIERSNEKIAGLIFGFPSTLVFSFFFLGWTIQSNIIGEIAPATFIPLGIAVLFTVCYFYFALFFNQFGFSKISEILLTFLASLSIWFSLAIPLGILHFSNFGLGILGYLVLILFSVWLLKLNKNPQPNNIKIYYTNLQKLIRAIFVGSLIALVVLMGKIASPFWAGIFTMFPATFSSALLIFHWYYAPNKIFLIIKRLPLGSLSLLAYAISTMYTFPFWGFIWGTLASCCISLFVSFSLSKIHEK